MAVCCDKLCVVLRLSLNRRPGAIVIFIATKHQTNNIPSRHRVAHFTLRDNENAYVSVNGETCWSKTGLVGTSGTQQCGNVDFKEERFPVIGCFATLEANTPLTVRVWTSLDGDAYDESFAIDNVAIQRLAEGNPYLVSIFFNYFILLLLL